MGDDGPERPLLLGAEGAGVFGLGRRVFAGLVLWFFHLCLPFSFGFGDRENKKPAFTIVTARVTREGGLSDP